MHLEKKKEAMLCELSAIKNSQERFAYLIAQGRQAPSLHEGFKTDAFRVEGCLAKLWFVSEFREGRCYFQVDSDSAIVKGISTVLCRFYSDSTPAEILAINPSFLEQAGISQHLTPNRRNSLARVWEKIREFAMANSGKLSG
jgi:cysteine desulfuration protein SufE